ncbi:MAG: apolipoprotein N-acyltransferase [Pseudomonadota bacterium]
MAASLTAGPLWRRCLVALLAGGLACLSLPPFDVWPVLFVSYTALVWLLDGTMQKPARKRRRFGAGFAIGWCFAFGYFVPSLWWISEAFWLEPEKFAALIPFAVAGLPAYLSLYWGLALGVAALLWMAGWPRILLLAGLIGAGEWLRGHLLTGFPWNLPGYGAGSLDGFAQTASLIGIYGMTVVVVVLAATPALFHDPGKAHRPTRRMVFPALVGAAAVTLQVWGNARVANYDAKLIESGATATAVRIVQPNISQKDKWDRAQAVRIIDTYLELSGRPFAGALQTPPVVVWPESALPRLLGEEHELRARIMASLPAGTPLLTGGLHRVTDPHGKVSIFNSLLAIPADGQIAARHDKVRLVPFGEFLPFQWLLEPLGLRQLANLPPGFSAGSEDRVIKLDGIPAFAGFICYEAVFPRSVPYASRPEMLVNATNDAWFGTSGGPHQHLGHARFRAIEQGVPMIRAANTGISAMIDAAGRVQARLALGTTGHLDVAMPLIMAATPYSVIGDLGFLALLILIFGIYIICRRMKKFCVPEVHEN